GRQEFAVVDIQHLGRDAENLGGLLNFGGSATRQRSARFAPVTNVAVGDGDKFDMMSLGGPHGGRSARLQFAIVRMSAKTNDAQLAVVRRNRIPLGRQFRLRLRVDGPSSRIGVTSNRASAYHQSHSKA